MEKVIAYLKENEERFLDELKQFLRFESVSADPDRADKVEECANWLAEKIKDAGAKTVEIFPTDGHPIVYAEAPGPKDAPTLLVYGHYDVQPEDPIELWESPPYEATIRDGAIFARGSADDKGQLYLYVKVLEAFMKVKGELPINIKMVFEGEEEVGSENLSKFLPEHKDLLACDVLAVSDSGMIQPGMPSITYGLRGLTFMQVELTAAKSDLHSGSFGGAVANPANVLAKVIASMHDEKNRITIDGFYDDVIEITEQERAEFAKLPHDDDEFLEALGAPALWGEEGYTTLERKWARPTLDVNGIWSGFIGEGAKTVLPSTAGAKISMRLVPNQDPDKIAELFTAHVHKVAPESVTVKVEKFHGGHSFLCPLDNPMLQAAARALEKGFGKAPVFNREGGSIPIVAEFDETLGAPILLLGYSVPNENAHAPNEFFLVENFYAGLRSSAYLMDELAK